MSGTAGAGNTTETRPDGVKTHHVVGVAMHKAATLALFALMLVGLLAAMLAYFDILVA